MRYYLAIFSSQCKQGQLDSWDQEVEKYFQGNGGYILFPALVTFLSQSQSSGFSLPREKKYITWMYNFIYKNNEFLETSGISWYETLKSLIIQKNE